MPTPEARQVFYRYFAAFVVIIVLQILSGWVSSRSALDIARGTNTDMYKNRERIIELETDVAELKAELKSLRGDR